MGIKETKDRRDKDRSTDYGYKSGDFQEMFQKMRMCCGGQGDFPDCKDMMERMMEMCSGLKTHSTEADYEQKTEDTKADCGKC